jgi:hypothetical protein
VARSLTPEEIKHLTEHARSYHELWKSGYSRQQS